MLKCNYVTILVTNECNMNCRECYVEQSKEVLTISDFKKYILNELIEMNVRYVAFSGGEPLLHPDIVSFIRISSERGLKTSLVTNGLLLSNDMAIKLKQAGLNRIQLSLDSNNQEINDMIRQKGCFDVVVNQAIPAALRAGLQVTLVAVPNDSIICNPEEYLDFATELGVHSVYFRRKIDTRNNYIVSDKKKYYDFLVKLHSIEKNYNISVSSGDPLYCLVQCLEGDKNTERVFSGCGAGITSIAIQPDGNIYPCTRLPIVVGNIKNDKISSVWNSNETLTKLRMRNFDGKCGKCSYLLICGGCRAACYAQYKKYDGEDPFCYYMEVNI